MFPTHQAWARRLAKLEVNQRRYASVINVLAEEIYDLKRLPEPARRPIGFKLDRK